MNRQYHAALRGVLTPTEQSDTRRTPSVCGARRNAGLRANAYRLSHELKRTVTAVSVSDEMLLAAKDALDRRTARYAPAPAPD